MELEEQETSERPVPPPLQPRCPDCSLCGEETNWEHDGYACQYCDAQWSERVTGGEPGSWLEPDEPQCEETTSPYVDNTWIPDDDPRKNLVFRCLLSDGHRAHPGVDGRPIPHANHEMTSCVKGWA